MARELHECLIRYFTRLEKLDDKWKDLSKKAERPLKALTNQAEQFRLVGEKAEGAVDIMDEETRERLIFKILMGFEAEFKLLLDILMQFNNANQDLKNYLDNLENVRSKISLKDETMRELIKGTPYRPKLNLLLQWAVEGFQFYHNMYLHINNCMKLIDCKTEETIDKLVSSFIEEKRGRKNLNRIFSFTQFLTKEAVPREPKKQELKRNKDSDNDPTKIERCIN